MKRNGRIPFIVLLMLLFPIYSPGLVNAHGGGRLYVNNTAIGNNTVSVWVSPPEPQSGETIHITVGIAGQKQEPVLDAEVMIDIFPAGQDEPVVSAPATTAQSINQLFYEADLPPLESGAYDVQVSVAHLDGSGTAVFSIAVFPANNPIWRSIIVLLAAAFTGLLFYLQWRKRTPIKQSPLARKKPYR